MYSKNSGCLKCFLPLWWARMPTLRPFCFRQPETLFKKIPVMTSINEVNA
ncbi:MAG: hypothetical protein IJ143_07375 [Neisseriaceae bacterium]|nr:hypothetical protein [Neisseriaceae bacterium]